MKGVQLEPASAASFQTWPGQRGAVEGGGASWQCLASCRKEQPASEPKLTVNPMTIYAVVGAGGWTGRACVETLLAEGHHVRCATRLLALTAPSSAPGPPMHACTAMLLAGPSALLAPPGGPAATAAGTQSHPADATPVHRSAVPLCPGRPLQGSCSRPRPLPRHLQHPAHPHGGQP